MQGKTDIRSSSIIVFFFDLEKTNKDVVTQIKIININKNTVLTIGNANGI